MIRIERSPAHPSTRVPLVFDSPHSGSRYPDDFRFAIDAMVLRRSEDAFVEELFRPVVRAGGVLLHALFPRCYIDPNRALEDVDTTMIEGDWPHAVRPSGKLARGAGLVWRSVKKYGDIYDRKLEPEEVLQRIAQCWKPYHQAVAELIDEAHTTHGVVIHLNCHSMASMGDHTTEDGPVARADFVLGDRDGTTCDAALTDTVARFLRDAGYRVAINDPYKGVELVRRYSDPARGRHSLQIEINRGLYMDEARIERIPGFERLATDIERLIDTLAEFADTMRTAPGTDAARR